MRLEQCVKKPKLIQSYCKVFQLTRFPSSDIRLTTDENCQTKGFVFEHLKLFSEKYFVILKLDDFCNLDYFGPIFSLLELILGNFDNDDYFFCHIH